MLLGFGSPERYQLSAGKTVPAALFFRLAARKILLRLKNKDLGRAARAQYQTPPQVEEDVEGRLPGRPAPTIVAAAVS